MIRNIVENPFTLGFAGMDYIEAYGLSSDDKPVTGIVTGSKFTEVDTGVEFRFDEVTATWIPQNFGNGKTSIVGATVTLGSSPAYDGTEKTQGVSSVKLGETTLTASTDYEVTENKAMLPGSYTLYIIGKGSYTGVIPKAYTIGKGAGSVTASPDTLTLTEGGDAGESTLTVTGDGALSVESSAEAVATAALEDSTVTVTPVGDGSATVTVTLAEGVMYEGATDTISVAVEAAAEPENNEQEGT